jgi:hypothetical protein
LRWFHRDLCIGRTRPIDQADNGAMVGQSDDQAALTLAAPAL